VLEQSYGGIEGDSASFWRVVRAAVGAGGRAVQAVLRRWTGSVNQHGEIQAMAGQPEESRVLFDVASALRLDGTQGVLIPIVERQAPDVAARRDRSRPDGRLSHLSGADRR